jgi:predicted aspartyl protease
MGTTTMGKTLVPAKIENLKDLYAVTTGTLKPEEVRSLETPDALVDTGATMLSLPTRMVDQLGLRRLRTRPVRISAGYVQAHVCDAVRLTVQGRECTVDVAEAPDISPVLIGQVPLELLDFLVDPINQRLIGNPEHGGEQMFDMF